MPKKILDAINNTQPLPDDVVLDKSIKKLKDAVEYLKGKYEFLWNSVVCDIEMREKGGGEFRFVENRDLSNLRIELAFRGLKLAKQDFRDVLNSKFLSVTYHPFRDYFDKLPKCESKFYYKDKRLERFEGRDYIREFCQQIYLQDESLRNDLIEGFRKWFVGIVVSTYDDEIHPYKINQLCFILIGGQAKYKTTFFEHIVPKQLREKYFYTGSVNFHDKDTEKRMGTKMVMTMEELANFNKNDIETIKAKITQPKITVRPAWFEKDLTIKRRVSFCGTQNNVEFLRDETGSRRFLIFEIERIVIDENFPLDKMYAQGLQHLRDGFKYWIDDEDIPKIEEMNEKFQLHSFEYELVSTYYEKPSIDDKGDFVKYLTTTDIAVKLSRDNNINVNQTVKKNIGSALRSLGFERISKKLDGRSLYVWRVKEKISTQIREDDII